MTAINRASHEARMVADWVEDCVGSSDYILLPTPQSPETFSIFQLLNIQPKIELVPTFRDHGSKQQLWNVQPVQVLHQDILPLNAQSMETFILGEPTRFDFLQYVSDQNPLRDQFKIYETRTSDFEGGLTAHTPRNLVPIANLNSPKVSVLALTDALEALDYVGVARKVSHWPKGGKFFDSRNLHGQRKYLQCVLSSTWVFSKGQKQFDSGRSQAYYAAVLTHPGEVDPKSSAKQCRELLALGDSALALPPPPPKAVAAIRPALLDIDGDEGATALPAKPSAPLPVGDVDHDEGDVKSTSSSSPSGSSSRSSARSISGDSASIDEPNVPKLILGQRVRVEAHQRTGDRGIRVTCPVHGARCRSFRSLTVDLERYGPNAATLFLSAWIKAATDGGMNFDDHRRHRPSHADVKRFIVSLGH